MKTQLRRRIACLTAGLAALALLVGPCVSWALDATGVTGSDTNVSQVTTAVDTTSSTVQTAAPTVDTAAKSTVDSTIQTTQVVVQQTESSVQTAAQTGSTAGAVRQATTRAASRASHISAGGPTTMAPRHAATTGTAPRTASPTTRRLQRASAVGASPASAGTRRADKRDASAQAGSAAGATMFTAFASALEASLPICDPGSLGGLLDPIEPVVAMICTATRSDVGSSSDPSPATPLVTDPQRRVAGVRAARLLPHAPRGAAFQRPGGGPALFATGSRGRGAFPFGARRVSGAGARGAFVAGGPVLYAHPIGLAPAAHHTGGGQSTSHFPLAVLGGAGFNATDLLMLLFAACWVAVAAVLIRRGSARILARAR